MTDLIAVQRAELERLVSQIDLSGLPFRVSLRVTERSAFPTAELYLQVVLHQVKDPQTGQLVDVTHETFIQPYLDSATFGKMSRGDGYLVHLLFRKLVEAVQHEVAEHFLFDGKRVFDPHKTA